MIQGGLDQAAGPNYKQSNTNLQSIVGGLISSALTLVGVLLLIYLIYAGFLWMTASDSKQVQTAKDIIKNAIIGLVIIFSAYAIANFVLAQLATIGGGTTPSGEQTKTQ